MNLISIPSNAEGRASGRVNATASFQVDANFEREEILTMFIEEDCTIELKGKKFESGGAVVTDTHIIAYPGKDGKLCDWHGNEIGTYVVLSSRPAVFFGHQSLWGSTYYYMRAKVNGVEYSLRGFGEGMAAKGKRLV